MIYTTTSQSQKPMQEILAKRFAEKLGGIYIKRNDRSIEMLQQTLGRSMILVCGQRVVLYVDGQGIFFHPSMAVVRIKRLLFGENDVVIEQCGVSSGDTVLDCTLGLGADAIVFSHVVGEGGRVIGIEANPVLAALVQYGLQTEDAKPSQVTAAMRRIKVVTGDHVTWLKKMPDHSVDIVYFDPMFRHTVTSSAAMNPLRAIAMMDPLSREAIEEAKRVARKGVVLKERRNSSEFHRLGFPPPKRRSGSIAYSRIDPD